MFISRGQTHFGGTRRTCSERSDARADQYKPLIIGYNKGAGSPAFRCGRCIERSAEYPYAGYLDGRTSITVITLPSARREHYRNGDRVQRNYINSGLYPAGHQDNNCSGSHHDIRASVSDVERTLIGSVILVILVVFVLFCETGGLY